VKNTELGSAGGKPATGAESGKLVISFKESENDFSANCSAPEVLESSFSVAGSGVPISYE
jgi:hypothetical protein